MLLEFAKFHKEAIEFVKPLHICRKKGISHSHVRAAIACAWWTADRNRLDEFITQLRDGMTMNDCDKALARLRDRLMTMDIGPQHLHEVFELTCSALQAYLAYKSVGCLRRSSVRFPLPARQEFTFRTPITSV